MAKPTQRTGRNEGRNELGVTCSDRLLSLPVAMASNPSTEPVVENDQQLPHWPWFFTSDTCVRRSGVCQSIRRDALFTNSRVKSPSVSRTAPFLRQSTGCASSTRTSSYRYPPLIWLRLCLQTSPFHFYGACAQLHFSDVSHTQPSDILGTRRG